VSKVVWSNNSEFFQFVFVIEVPWSNIGDHFEFVFVIEVACSNIGSHFEFIVLFRKRFGNGGYFGHSWGIQTKPIR